MNNLCIITARGGSKRIPYKNIKLFNGKPIIAYAIETALASNLFSEVMVSTDDDLISKVAIQYGASVPFLRSPKNSDDFSGTAEVLLEVIEQYQENNISFDSFCCIYPTAPFITTNLLQLAYHKMITGNFDSVYPVQKFTFPIQRAVYLQEDKLSWVDPNSAFKRSQDLPETYHDAGQFYWSNYNQFIRTKKILTANSSAIVIDEMAAQDIDNLEDWVIAEFKYNYLQREQQS